ncbi:hypothetical protein N7510_001741 [Penicillium lagena]|uniref:uncharacterized protein n=1 Tax=Penicillium lagena TaxID=94218 RepID=UPI0025413F83|nr:uncharacterized protein N7510_001741 [Penicillium lagena]KAJ5625432.1 hypothetical protein N7510_001741 [Penicillium lagena]
MENLPVDSALPGACSLNGDISPRSAFVASPATLFPSHETGNTTSTAPAIPPGKAWTWQTKPRTAKPAATALETLSDQRESRRPGHCAPHFLRYAPGSLCSPSVPLPTRNPVTARPCAVLTRDPEAADCRIPRVESPIVPRLRLVATVTSHA